jgi:hypothetical protein
LIGEKKNPYDKTSSKRQGVHLDRLAVINVLKTFYTDE